MSEARPEDTVREDLDADGFGYWPKEAQDAILRREAALAALVAELATLRREVLMLRHENLLRVRRASLLRGGERQGAGTVIGYGTPLVCSPGRREILRDVSAERDRQDGKWGGVPGEDRRDDPTYAAVLGEEFGEACQAWLERNTTALRDELVQVAAVAVAWIEELDNGGSVPRQEPGQ